MPDPRRGGKPLQTALGHSRWLARAAFLLCAMAGLCSALSGCVREDEGASSARQEPADIEDAAGAVCGMIVREQPAPRAQVIHRDGTRLFLCGIGDLLAHLQAPSPHGAPVQILVEAMEPDEDPREVHLGPHDWIRAQDASYRLGDPRPAMVMGEPIMVYRDRTTAETAMRYGPVRILDFAGLESWWQQRNRESAP